MKKRDKQKALKLIEDAGTIGLVSHVRMDPDAFACVLGAQEVLEGLGKKVIVFSEEELLPLLKNFDPKTKYNPNAGYQNIDLIFVMDTAVPNRIAAPKIVSNIENLPGIVIDHHATEPAKNSNWLYFIEQTGAAAELVYKLFKELGFTINKKAAGYFCFGILSDTNDLKFPNTTDQSRNIVKEILKNYGQEFYERNLLAAKKDYEKKLKFYEYCLAKAFQSKKYNALITVITKEELEKFKILEGIGSQVANYMEEKGGKGSFVFMEFEENKVKASLRSNNIPLNVRKIAEKFGGGGHDNAAGFVVEGSIQSVVEKFL